MRKGSCEPEAIRNAAALLSKQPEERDKLVMALSLVADEIRKAWVEAESSPKRGVVRTKLAELCNAATQVSCLLQDPDIDWLPSYVAIFRPDIGTPDYEAKMGYEHGRMSALAADAAWMRDRIPAGAGTNTLGDILGAVRGRHLCAVAAVQFFKLIGRTPLGKSNPTAQEFCALMWEAAGGKVSDAVKCGDMVDTAAWERHLQEARNPRNPAATISARLLVCDIINETGLRDAFPPKKRK